MNDEILLPSDAELLASFQRDRDEAAFARLVERHGRLVMGVCRQIICHRQDAEDAFQATFLILALRAKSLHRASSVASWLYKVAFRTAMRAAKHRQRRRAEAIREEDAGVDEDALEKIHAQSLQKELHEELSLLPDTYRGPLILCYLENRTREEAARELESTEASVKARLARGKQMLRLRLAHRGIGLTSVMAVTVPDIADATQPVRVELVTKTVRAAQSGPSLPECSTEVVSLVKEGTRAMVRSMMAKPVLLTACVLGTVCLTWSLRAGDVGEGNGAEVVVDATTQVDPASGNDGPPIDVGSQPVPIEALQAQQVEELQAQQIVDDPNLAKQRLQIQKRYLLLKAGAYEKLSHSMQIKARQAGNPSDELDAEGRAELYAAEAYQLEKHAELADEEVKLLEANAGIEPGHVLPIVVTGTPADRPIAGSFSVDDNGTVNLGPGYGSVHLEGLSLGMAEQKLSKHLQGKLEAVPEVKVTWGPDPLPVIEPGDVIRIVVLGTTPDRPIAGLFCVEPTGKVPLGPGYGRVNLGGLSLEEAEAKLKEHLQKHLKSPEVQIMFRSGVRG